MTINTTKVTIAVIFAVLSTTAVCAEVYNYSCKACIFPRIVTDDGSDGCDVVEGKTYPLRVDEKKNVLEWRGKKYSLAEQPNCGKYVGMRRAMERLLTSVPQRRDTETLRTRMASRSDVILKDDRLSQLLRY